ncbi:hypothetical protein ACFL00_02790 [Pseudomonadota bacterium]
MDKRIEKLQTPESCRIFAKNAEERNRPDLAKEALQREADLRAAQYGVQATAGIQEALEFKNDDEGYFAWITTHPDGYVLNVRAKPDPNYVVVHRASCGSISSAKLGRGAYTSNDFRKWCSDDLIELQFAAKKEGRKNGTFSKKCPHCMG